MSLMIKHITIVLALILTVLTPIYAQLGRSCSVPINKDATTPSTQNGAFIIAGGEFWIEFKIDPLTANRYAMFSMNDNGNQTKYDYDVYGPFDNSYSCSSLGAAFLSGSSYLFNNPSASNNCITYTKTTQSPPISFGMSSSSNTRYYLLKISLHPGAYSNQQNINISATPTTPVITSVQTTYCPGYIEGTDVPCATNDNCRIPITLCTDFTQTHNCSSCGLQADHNRFYAIDIQYPNTTVNLNVPTFYTNSAVIYSISNQIIYGPCDPNLMLPINLLHSFSGQSTSYTFTNTGLYLLNVAIRNTECPTVEIDFVDIDSNCQPVVTPPTIDFQAVCVGNNLSSIINLVYNGDFEVGNYPETVTQIISDDNYQPNNLTNPAEGKYTIVQAPFTINSVIINNHTSNVGNNGYFMFAHDNLLLTSNEFIWKKQVPNILPNTSYTFEAWFTPSVIESSSGTDNLNLYINNQLVASKNRSTITPGVWEKIDFVWNSTTNTNANLKIEIENNNMVDDGRIFIDDISFKMVEPEMECCNNQEIIFDITSNGDTTGIVFSWDFGDSSPTSSSNTHTYANPGTYIITLDITYPNSSTATITHSITILDCDYICETCIGSFAPIPGQSYVVSAWAKEQNAPAVKTTYDNPELSLLFNDGNNTILGPFAPTGDIIDGWQRIEVEFIIPSTAQDMEILLGSASGDVLFDDIRVLPFNSNMKSFVYDPINLRLVAELDERHYATFYEYDEEGQLIRVKKETERGIVTIQESRSNTSKVE